MLSIQSLYYCGQNVLGVGIYQKEKHPWQHKLRGGVEAIFLKTWLPRIYVHY